ncbi:hypothetical protein B484DRAFT_297743, partial [Ochromonadaceae sp. CCMP2298]
RRGCDAMLVFPENLYQILERESREIICWHQDGMSFHILDSSRFERKIMPKYFNKRQTKFKSIQWRLKVYGFKR